MQHFAIQEKDKEYYVIDLITSKFNYEKRWGSAVVEHCFKTFATFINTSDILVFVSTANRINRLLLIEFRQIVREFFFSNLSG